MGAKELRFLFDVHNTLIDNERVQADLSTHICTEYGPYAYDRYPYAVDVVKRARSQGEALIQERKSGVKRYGLETCRRSPHRPASQSRIGEPRRADRHGRRGEPRGYVG